MTAQGPIIFLSISQVETGQTDSSIAPIQNFAFPYTIDESSLNFTRASEVLQQQEVAHYMSPRYKTCPIDWRMQVSRVDETSGEQTQIVSNGTMCMLWLDTEKEKEIGLGTGWPYKKLNPGECLVPASFAQKGV